MYAALLSIYTCGSLTDGTAHVAAPPKCRPVSIHADTFMYPYVDGALLFRFPMSWAIPRLRV